MLTIVPVPSAGASGGRALGHAVAYFPFVGLVLGVATAALDTVLRLVFPIPVAAALDLVFLAVATGGLHLDGLADAADGLFAGGDRSRRLDAMRDSRTGAFGVAAVALVVLLEFSALSSIGAGDRAAALIVAVTLSRWAMSLALWSFPPARSDGLGAAFARRVTLRDVTIASAVMGLVAGALMSAVVATIAVAVAVVLVMIVGAVALSRLGGLTGDVYGAIGELVVACELTALTAPRI